MKKSKLLTSLAVAATAITPVVFAASCSCSSKYDPLTAEFKKQAIQEFIELVKVPHTSGYTYKMRDHLKEYLSPYIVKDSWYEDAYRNEKSKDTSSGNICFDIKATENCETWPGITLQGHYDMVGAGELESNPDKGVDAIVDGNKMHSKNYATSLGADDGIGLGIIITIIKNQDKFKHGPIHVLLTSDEEEDKSGAYLIAEEKYDLVKYHNLINLDAEADKKITVSCASTHSSTFNFKFETGEKQGEVSDFEEIPTTTKKADFCPYTIRVSGLLGGHSANCINEGRLSAIKILAEILSKLNYNYDLNIISFIANNKSNAICNEAETTFYLEQTTIKQIQDWLITPTINRYKMTNPIETNLKIEISEDYLDPTIPGAPAKMLTPKGSWKLYTILKDIPFGPIEWIGDDTKEVATSNNIGNVKYIYTAQSSDLTLKCFCRSCIEGDDAIVHKFTEQMGKNIFGDGYYEVSQPDTSPTWAYKEKNQLFDLYSKGYEECGITPTKRNAHSWLECAYFCQQTEHKNDRMVAVGPLITDAHSIKETLYLDTLDPLISSLLYTLQNAEKLQ